MPFDAEDRPPSQRRPHAPPEGTMGTPGHDIFRVRAPSPVSGQLSETANWKGWLPGPGFPLRFRRRHSLLGHPTPAKGSALLTVGPQPKGLDPDGVTAFRTHELRPGWVPPVPRGRRCSSRTEARSQPAPAAPPRLVPEPRHNIPPGEAPLHEASNRGSRRSPVRSSPRPRPRDGTSGASASP